MKYKWKSHGNAYGHKTAYTSDKGGWIITRIEGGVTLWKVNRPKARHWGTDVHLIHDPDNGEPVYKRTLKDAKRYCEEHDAIMNAITGQQCD